jgi:hypothetical protein
VEGGPKGGMGAGQGGDGVIVDSQDLAKIQQIQTIEKERSAPARLLVTKSKGASAASLLTVREGPLLQEAGN